jgi:predicted nucleotidyltransferase
MVNDEIVRAVQRYARAVTEHGVPVRFIIVFGSWVRGRADQWSDIDVVVVSPQFDGGARLDDVLLLWRVAGETDTRIEPIACGERQWVEDDASAIIEIARREGQRIDPDEAIQPVRHRAEIN